MPRRTGPLRSDAVLERLQGLHPRLIDLSLGRIETLLAALGNPERQLGPVVHVAGTNGKGSTVAFLHAMAEAAGATVHSYTSPHLVRFHERIVIAGQPIADDALVEALEACEAANDGAEITFFEVTTAAAFLALSRTPADLVLLETGLGGRFDATNVIAHPIATVITQVAMDHMHYLGDTLGAIAFEKAGILKPGVPCVSAAQQPGAGTVIDDRAKEVGAPMIRGGIDWHVETRSGGFVYREGGETMKLPSPALPGRHQIDNAGLAIACLRHMGVMNVGTAAVEAGLRTARWPGRLQRIDDGKLAARLPTGWELWLDGAHNPAAATAIAAFAEGWRNRPLHLIVGMLNNRDPKDFLPPLAAEADRVVTVTIPGVESSAIAAESAAAAAEVGIKASAADGVIEAIDAITSAAPAPSRILICGSLYLAGHVLTINGG